MPRIELARFAEEHAGGAAALLAERHARHRADEPLLADVADFAERIARAGEGMVALENGRVAGYVIGSFRMDLRSFYVGTAGHAVTEPELARDLYAAAAARWADEGHTRHAVLVPASDTALLDAWFRLSFGQQQAYAVRETTPTRSINVNVEVRDATERDIDFIASLDIDLYRHQREAPTFSGWEEPSLDESRAEIHEELTWPGAACFVAERDGVRVGALILTRTARDFIVDGAIDLSFAATVPEARGTGVGLALTAHALAWAHERGYRAVTTDWRVTNLLSSRFWPRLGFRPAFLRLYRSLL